MRCNMVMKGDKRETQNGNCISSYYYPCFVHLSEASVAVQCATNSFHPFPSFSFFCLNQCFICFDLTRSLCFELFSRRFVRCSASFSFPLRFRSLLLHIFNP